MDRKLLWVALFILALCQTTPALTAAHAARPLAKAGQVEDEILLRFKEGVPEKTKTMIHDRVGGKKLKAFRIVRGLEAVKLSKHVSVQDAVRLYGESPEVLYAEPNYIARGDVVPDDPSFSSLWGLQKINASTAWNLGIGSSNVIVGTVDSGIDYNHPDLSSNLWRNETDCNGNGLDDDGNGYIDDCHGIDTVNHDSDPMDDLNHGTHVAGTIGAAGNNGIGVVGINWNISLAACKFLGSDNSGPLSAAIECLEYFKSLKDRGVNIVATNNSWYISDYYGGPGSFSRAVYDAVEAHRKAGILFIASAGNSGLNSDDVPTYPAANYQSNIISVAATNSGDVLPSFSNYGKRSVHVAAPGVSILSTAPGNKYVSMSGTSMATPHVTGLAALLKAFNPALEWKGIKNLVLSGGDRLPSAGTTMTGRRINALGTLSCGNPPILARIKPASNRVSTSVGMPVDLSALHIQCALPNGEVSASVDKGGSAVLRDDGAGFDQDEGDGIYSGQWAPPAEGKYSLAFPGDDVLLVDSLKNYRVQPVSSPYITIGGTSLNLADDESAGINSPFPILFGGSSYDRLTVHSNGTLSFSSAIPPSLNGPLPTGGTDTLVAAFWDDLFPVSGTAQNVFWQVTGTLPDRRLIVEWRDVRHAFCSTDPAAVRFQVVFFEGRSDVLFNYADTSFAGSCKSYSGGAGATIGIQIARNVGRQYSLNQNLGKTRSLLWTLVEDPPFDPPLLSAPADASNGVSLNPAFTWSGVPGATSYRIMVALDQKDLPAGPWVDVCPNCMINAVSATTSFASTVTLASGARYYWQVKALGNSGQPGTWSRPSTFMTDPVLPPPGSVNPPNGTKDTATTPTFSWSPVPGATSYRIMVATSQSALPADPLAATCPECIVNMTSTTTSFTPAVPLVPNTVYYWEVRAEGDFGGYWITGSSFTTIAVYPASIPVNPSANAIGVPVRPTFRWIEVPGAPRYRLMAALSPTLLPDGPTDTRCNKCAINATSASAAYTSTVALKPGTLYYWQVRPEGPSGEGGYWSQKQTFSTIPTDAGIISINSVAPGALVEDHFVLVRGYLNVAAGTEVGVTVNNYTALTDAGQFAVQVPLDATVTGLTAVARDAFGNILGSQTVPIAVRIPVDEPILTLIPQPVIGQCPLTVQFAMKCAKPVTRSDFDSDGDGTPEVQNSLLEGEQVVYEVPGLFFPKVSAMDNSGSTHVRNAIVWALSRYELEPLLQSKWAAMKNALRSGDIQGALKYIMVSRRPRYEKAFRNLSIPYSQVDQVFTSIDFVEMNGPAAEYQMLRTDAQGETAYLVRFHIDEDGIWRIETF